MLFSLFTSAALYALASAQGSATNSSQTVVPSGVPIQGDYTGALRPQIHFSPPKAFMNDPNGAFRDADGLWHLYYQYNPTQIVAGNQHWGHATSEDLYRWENQPIALFPDKQGDGIFSGSIVIDSNNTSGFFPNQTNGVVAIYTLNTPLEQTQEIAYSYDGGYSFTKYANNPVISINSTQFRDPKVIWYEDHWVMLISYSQEFVMGIFTSPDLIDWTHASNITDLGLLGLQYECPNMVKIPNDGSDEDTYVLLISINPGAPQGGSFTEYFPGTFNGTHFEPFDHATRIFDFGKDNYAGQFFYEDGSPDTDPVFIGWASNWQYTQQVPTGPLEGWRSSMTIPRTARLNSNEERIGYNLVTAPYENLEPVKGDIIGEHGALVNESLTVDYSTVHSGAVYFAVNVTNIPNVTLSKGTLNFTFTASSTNESVAGGFFFGGDTPFWFNRGKVTGFDNPFFTDKFSTNNLLPYQVNSFMLEVVIDRTIIEIFLDGGDRSAVATFFPEGKIDTLTIGTNDMNNDVGVHAEVWSLESGWAPTGY
ncbi:beta-fructofuranosidase [Phlyctema vagabunda]|uniref:Beta-fructofuranosidase n=1 Tax=Phlyctema vagabunda TaxID=108571 RepID=A0ABR4P7N3_9HELO